MSRVSTWRARAFLVAVLIAFLVGCANTPQGTGGSGWDSGDPAPGPSAKELAAASRAEASQVAAEVWAVASGVRGKGSKLEFTFWSEQGALTLTRYTMKEPGGARARPADENDTRNAVTEALLAAVQQRTGEVVLRLWRRESSWEVSHDFSAYGAAPPEARKAAGHRGAFSVGQAPAMAAGVQQWLKPVEVPASGTVWVDLAVRLRDGHVVGWDLENWRIIKTGRGDKPRPVSSNVATEVANVLRLYTPGSGARTVRLGLRLSHDDNASTAGGWVETGGVSH